MPPKFESQEKYNNAKQILEVIDKNLRLYHHEHLADKLHDQFIDQKEIRYGKLKQTLPNENLRTLLSNLIEQPSTERTDREFSSVNNSPSNSSGQISASSASHTQQGAHLPSKGFIGNLLSLVSQQLRQSVEDGNIEPILKEAVYFDYLPVSRQAEELASQDSQDQSLAKLAKFSKTKLQDVDEIVNKVTRFADNKSKTESEFDENWRNIKFDEKWRNIIITKFLKDPNATKDNLNIETLANVAKNRQQRSRDKDDTNTTVSSDIGEDEDIKLSDSDSDTALEEATGINEGEEQEPQPAENQAGEPNDDWQNTDQSLYKAYKDAQQQYEKLKNNGYDTITQHNQDPSQLAALSPSTVRIINQSKDDYKTAYNTWSIWQVYFLSSFYTGDQHEKLKGQIDYIGGHGLENPKETIDKAIEERQNKLLSTLQNLSQYLDKSSLSCGELPRANLDSVNFNVDSSIEEFKERLDNIANEAKQQVNTQVDDYETTYRQVESCRSELGEWGVDLSQYPSLGHYKKPEKFRQSWQLEIQKTHIAQYVGALNQVCNYVNKLTGEVKQCDEQYSQGDWNNNLPDLDGKLSKMQGEKSGLVDKHQQLYKRYQSLYEQYSRDNSPLPLECNYSKDAAKYFSDCCQDFDTELQKLTGKIQQYQLQQAKKQSWANKLQKAYQNVIDMNINEVVVEALKNRIKSHQGEQIEPALDSDEVERYAELIKRYSEQYNDWFEVVKETSQFELSAFIREYPDCQHGEDLINPDTINQKVDDYLGYITGLVEIWREHFLNIEAHQVKLQDYLEQHDLANAHQKINEQVQNFKEMRNNTQPFVDELQTWANNGWLDQQVVDQLQLPTSDDLQNKLQQTLNKNQAELDRQKQQQEAAERERRQQQLKEAIQQQINQLAKDVEDLDQLATTILSQVSDADLKQIGDYNTLYSEVTQQHEEYKKAYQGFETTLEAIKQRIDDAGFKVEDFQWLEYPNQNPNHLWQNIQEKLDNLKEQDEKLRQDQEKRRQNNEKDLDKLVRQERKHLISLYDKSVEILKALYLNDKSTEQNNEPTDLAQQLAKLKDDYLRKYRDNYLHYLTKLAELKHITSLDLEQEFYNENDRWVLGVADFNRHLESIEDVLYSFNQLSKQCESANNLYDRYQQDWLNNLDLTQLKIENFYPAYEAVDDNPDPNAKALENFTKTIVECDDLVAYLDYDEQFVKTILGDQYDELKAKVYNLHELRDDLYKGLKRRKLIKLFESYETFCNSIQQRINSLHSLRLSNDQQSHDPYSDFTPDSPINQLSQQIQELQQKWQAFVKAYQPDHIQKVIGEERYNALDQNISGLETKLTNQIKQLLTRSPSPNSQGQSTHDPDAEAYWKAIMAANLRGPKEAFGQIQQQYTKLSNFISAKLRQLNVNPGEINQKTINLAKTALETFNARKELLKQAMDDFYNNYVGTNKLNSTFTGITQANVDRLGENIEQLYADKSLDKRYQNLQEQFEQQQIDDMKHTIQNLKEQIYQKAEGILNQSPAIKEFEKQARGYDNIESNYIDVLRRIKEQVERDHPLQVDEELANDLQQYTDLYNQYQKLAKSANDAVETPEQVQTKLNEKFEKLAYKLDYAIIDEAYQKGLDKLSDLDPDNPVGVIDKPKDTLETIREYIGKPAKTALDRFKEDYRLNKDNADAQALEQKRSKFVEQFKQLESKLNQKNSRAPSSEPASPTPRGSQTSSRSGSNHPATPNADRRPSTPGSVDSGRQSAASVSTSPTAANQHRGGTHNRQLNTIAINQNINYKIADLQFQRLKKEKEDGLKVQNLQVSDLVRSEPKNNYKLRITPQKAKELIEAGCFSDEHLYIKKDKLEDLNKRFELGINNTRQKFSVVGLKDYFRQVRQKYSEDLIDWTDLYIDRSFDGLYNAGLGQLRDCLSVKDLEIKGPRDDTFKRAIDDQGKPNPELVTQLNNNNLKHYYGINKHQLYGPNNLIAQALDNQRQNLLSTYDKMYQDNSNWFRDTYQNKQNNWPQLYRYKNRISELLKMAKKIEAGKDHELPELQRLTKDLSREDYILEFDERLSQCESLHRRIADAETQAKRLLEEKVWTLDSAKQDTRMIKLMADVKRLDRDVQADLNDNNFRKPFCIIEEQALLHSSWLIENKIQELRERFRNGLKKINNENQFRHFRMDNYRNQLLSYLDATLDKDANLDNDGDETLRQYLNHEPGQGHIFLQSSVDKGVYLKESFAKLKYWRLYKELSDGLNHIEKGIYQLTYYQLNQHEQTFQKIQNQIGKLNDYWNQCEHPTQKDFRDKEQDIDSFQNRVNKVNNKLQNTRLKLDKQSKLDQFVNECKQIGAHIDQLQTQITEASSTDDLPAKALQQVFNQRDRLHYEELPSLKSQVSEQEVEQATDELKTVADKAKQLNEQYNNKTQQFNYQTDYHEADGRLKNLESDFNNINKQLEPVADDINNVRDLADSLEKWTLSDLSRKWAKLDESLQQQIKDFDPSTLQDRLQDLQDKLQEKEQAIQVWLDKKHAYIDAFEKASQAIKDWQQRFDPQNLSYDELVELQKSISDFKDKTLDYDLKGQWAGFDDEQKKHLNEYDINSLFKPLESLQHNLEKKIAERATQNRFAAYAQFNSYKELYNKSQSQIDNWHNALGAPELSSNRLSTMLEEMSKFEQDEILKLKGDEKLAHDSKHFLDQPDQEELDRLKVSDLEDKLVGVRDEVKTTLKQQAQESLNKYLQQYTDAQNQINDWSQQIENAQTPQDELPTLDDITQQGNTILNNLQSQADKLNGVLIGYLTGAEKTSFDNHGIANVESDLEEVENKFKNKLSKIQIAKQTAQQYLSDYEALYNAALEDIEYTIAQIDQHNVSIDNVPNFQDIVELKDQTVSNLEKAYNSVASYQAYLPTGSLDEDKIQVVKDKYNQLQQALKAIQSKQDLEGPQPSISEEDNLAEQQQSVAVSRADKGLSQEVDNTQQAIREAEQANEKTGQDIAAYEQALSDLNQQQAVDSQTPIISLEDKMGLHSDEGPSLNVATQVLEAELATLRGNLANSNRSHEAINEQIDALSRALHQLWNQLALPTDKPFVNADHHLAEQSSSIEPGQLRLQDLETKRAELDSQADLADYQQLLDAYQAAITELQRLAEVEQPEATFTQESFKTEVVSPLPEIGSSQALERAVADLRATSLETEQAQAEALAEIQALESALTSLRNKKGTDEPSLSVTSEEPQADVSDLVEMSELVVEELANLRKRLNQSELDPVTYDQQLADLQQALKAIQSKQDLEGPQPSISEEDNLAEQQQSVAVSRADKGLSQEVDNTQQAVDSKQQEIDSKQQEIDSKQQEIDSKRAQIERKNMESEDNKNQFSSRENNTDGVRGKFEAEFKASVRLKHSNFINKLHNQGRRGNGESVGLFYKNPDNPKSEPVFASCTVFYQQKNDSKREANIPFNTETTLDKLKDNKQTLGIDPASSDDGNQRAKQGHNINRYEIDLDTSPAESHAASQQTNVSSTKRSKRTINYDVNNKTCHLKSTQKNGEKDLLKSIYTMASLGTYKVKDLDRIKGPAMQDKAKKWFKQFGIEVKDKPVPQPSNPAPSRNGQFSGQTFGPGGHNSREDQQKAIIDNADSVYEQIWYNEVATPEERLHHDIEHLPKLQENKPHVKVDSLTDAKTQNQQTYTIDFGDSSNDKVTYKIDTQQNQITYEIGEASKNLITNIAYLVARQLIFQQSSENKKDVILRGNNIDKTILNSCGIKQNGEKLELYENHQFQLNKTTELSQEISPQAQLQKLDEVFNKNSPSCRPKQN